MAGTILCKALRPAVGLVVLIALLHSPVRGAEPILTLAMVGHDVTPRQSTVHSRFSVASAPLPTVRPVEPLTADSLRVDALEAGAIEPSVFLEKVAPARRGHPIFSTGQYWTEQGHSKLWSRLAAGYGEVFYDPTVVNHYWVVYGRNGYEEPGCGYVKISLNF